MAIAKEAVASGVGMTLDFGKGDTLASLFGEGGPRAVYFVSPEERDKFIETWKDYPLISLGRVSGDTLKIEGTAEIPLDVLAWTYSGGKGLLEAPDEEKPS